MAMTDSMGFSPVFVGAVGLCSFWQVLPELSKYCLTSFVVFQGIIWNCSIFSFLYHEQTVEYEFYFVGMLYLCPFRYKGRSAFEMALFVGLTNGMWLFLPLIGMWVSYRFITDQSFAAVRI